ncbi:aldo/keto reductase [Anaerovoracaceae bacterium 41-7]|uniref:aldo/keto reductase n=1 Tax=Senimuribacter intestinalis TaxID=2941507 RepID=UPI00203C30B0|nr:aldo/keto reductase [Senimuribacter intestinalis]
MIYKDFQDLKLSALGFGAMRLPTVDGKDAEIDKQAASAMVSEAMKKGINYYDTAWGYHEGNSELIMGEILSEYPRDSFYLATKFPGYDLSNMDKVEEIFEKQLEKCRADHFDFYLFHNVCEMNIDAYLDESHGIFAYLMEQKQNGRIKHLGFSAHGEAPVMRRFLEKYGKEMEFCQIQLNYLDLKFQDAQAKLELLKEYEIPVWVMEPLRGGRLANLTEEETAKLAALRPDETAVSWAFRFLQSIPEVTMILSGMSNMEQLLANIETFETEKSLNQNEQRVLQKIADEMAAKVALPCTECRYCTTHCPQGLDIPYLLSLYNEHRSTTLAGGMSFIAPMALSAVEKEKQPSACIGCGSCEAVCPQQIKISQAMKEFVGALGM